MKTLCSSSVCHLSVTIEWYEQVNIASILISIWHFVVLLLFVEYGWRRFGLKQLPWRVGAYGKTTFLNENMVTSSYNCISWNVCPYFMVIIVFACSEKHMESNVLLLILLSFSGFAFAKWRLFRFSITIFMSYRGHIVLTSYLLLLLVQACIAMLHDRLGLTIGEKPPEDPRKIKLPASFSLEAYSTDVLAILRNNKMYKSDVMFSKIEDEYHKNAYAILVDVFETDGEGKLSKEKVKLSLHYLLNQYPFSEYTKAIVAFSHKVESQVSEVAPLVYPATVNITIPWHAPGYVLNWLPGPAPSRGQSSNGGDLCLPLRRLSFPPLLVLLLKCSSHRTTATSRGIDFFTFVWLNVTIILILPSWC